MEMMRMNEGDENLTECVDVPGRGVYKNNCSLLSETMPPL